METLILIKDEYRSILVIGLVTCAVYIVMSIRQKSTNSQEKVNSNHIFHFFEKVRHFESDPETHGKHKLLDKNFKHCFSQIIRIFFTNVRNENSVLYMLSTMYFNIKNLQRVGSMNLQCGGSK